MQRHFGHLVWQIIPALCLRLPQILQQSSNFVIESRASYRHRQHRFAASTLTVAPLRVHESPADYPEFPDCGIIRLLGSPGPQAEWEATADWKKMPSRSTQHQQEPQVGLSFPTAENYCSYEAGSGSRMFIHVAGIQKKAYNRSGRECACMQTRSTFVTSLANNQTVALPCWPTPSCDLPVCDATYSMVWPPGVERPAAGKQFVGRNVHVP